MKNLAKKVAIGLSTGALLANAMIAPVLGLEVIVTGNGTNSDNTANISQTNNNVVTQTNSATIVNNIDADAETGENDANDNTGGDVAIDTGDAVTKVTVKNTTNSNEASVGCSGCPTDVTATISGNGSNSDNDVNLGLTNQTFVTQTNASAITNNIDADAETGENDAEDNTGGDVSIDTGKAKVLLGVFNQANANVAHVGAGDSEGWLELLITGNGSDSDSTLNVGLSNAVVLGQVNTASILNDIEMDAETGENDANDNTGGDVSIDTGEAFAGAIVDNWANFNLANVEDCCVLDGLVKVAGNGERTDNDVNLTLASLMTNTQLNRYGQLNDLDVDAETGENDAEDNTGGVDSDPSIDTGNASTEVEVDSVGNSNIFSTGDGLSNDDQGWWNDWELENGNMFVWLLAMMSL